ncbi:MAG: PhzF family phenazine biosynthesis protein [Actinobacteria bacterium]|nr:PhzF family phenazine biosynthesis protein [Actinomycetota bacterium]
MVALGGSVIVVADRCATTGATSAPATAPDTGTGRDTATDTPAGVSEGPGLAALGGSAGRVDSVCRVFVPGSGIAEDPVTGAAHCAIAPWLAARTGRTSFVGEQASARGGRVVMRVQGDRVVLRGAAVTVLTGALTAEPGRHAGGGTR